VDVERTPVVATLSKYPPYVSGHAMQAYWNGRALADLTGRPHHQVTYNGPVPVEFDDRRITAHEVHAAAEPNPKVLDGHLEKALAGALVGLGATEVDVLLSYYADPHAAITMRAARALRRTGRQVVVASSVEGSDLTDSLARHVADHEAAVLLADILAADVVFAVSHFVAGELVSLVRGAFGDQAGDETESRLVLRYPGLPPEAFVPANDCDQADLRAGLAIPPDAPVLSTYVRLVPEKGVRQLLDVAGVLADLEPDAHVVIAGDGPLRAELMTAIGERGLRKVHLAGHLEPHEAAVLRSISALGLFPSRPTPTWTETFGISPLEYEALGRPVLVSDIGGTAESTAVPEFRLPLDAGADAWAGAASALLRDAPRVGKVASDFAAEFTSARAAETILAAVAPFVSR
jgi:glycosyltransferase involved in cell wall biosynthesis